MSRTLAAVESIGGPDVFGPLDMLAEADEEFVRLGDERASAGVVHRDRTAPHGGMPGLGIADRAASSGPDVSTANRQRFDRAPRHGQHHRAPTERHISGVQIPEGASDVTTNITDRPILAAQRIVDCGGNSHARGHGREP
jgi:hypothetical protein